MNKSIISLLTVIILAFGASVMLSSSGIKIGTPKVSPSGPYNVGDVITFSVACWAQQDIASIKIVGGVEGQANILNGTYKNWATGVRKWIAFKWQPANGGSYVLFAEVDPDNLLGYKEKITINVDVQQASPGITLYEMPNPQLTPFGVDEPKNKKKPSKFTVLEHNLVDSPDLIIADIKINPSITTTQQIIKAEALVKNIGKAGIGTDTQFWISFEIDKKIAKTTNFLGLGAGDERMADFTFYFPLDELNEGTHDIVVFADSSRVVQESEENNNLKSSKFNIDSHTGKIKLNDWYFSGLGKPKTDEFTSSSQPLVLNMVFNNNGKLPFTGKLLSYGFENPEAGGLAKNNIPANLQLNIQPNSTQTIQIPNVQPSFFMSFIPKPQENVKVLYGMEYNINGKSEPKTFTYLLPDLIVTPERYSVQCPFLAEPKMQVYGKIELKGSIPEGETIPLRVTWQRWIKGGWGKAGNMKNEEKFLYYSTPLTNTYFAIEGIEGDSWFTTSGGRVMNICFEVDYQDKITEINETNNRVCGRLLVSRIKDECVERSNVPFQAQ